MRQMRFGEVASCVAVQIFVIAGGSECRLYVGSWCVEVGS